MPDLRRLGPWVISVPTEIAVRVRVDETGTVTDASPVTTDKSPNRLLASAALIAARQWKFTPGMVRGKPVAADHTIIFEFRPKAH
jgi:TonB family protein